MTTERKQRAQTSARWGEPAQCSCMHSARTKAGRHTCIKGAGVRDAADAAVQGARDWRENGAAARAHRQDGVVAARVQAVVQEVGGAMREQRVAFHLPESDPPAQLAPLDGLARQRIYAPCRPHLHRGLQHHQMQFR